VRLRDLPQVSRAKHKVIFQVEDNDLRKRNLALNDVNNMQGDPGKDNVEIELVAYGPGLPMPKLESQVANRIADTLARGVNVLECENSMTNTKTTRADMLPNIGYVKAGVTTLMARQREGWAYIRS
jgi:intracellular sulfur oxidation DsrE/DsrF family protein